MKKQLLLALNLLAISFIVEPSCLEHKKRLKGILEYYNQEIANIKRPILNGKSYKQIENAPDLNFFSLSERYSYDEILKKLRLIEIFYLEKLNNTLEDRALATQEANEDDFLEISKPQSDYSKGLDQKIKEINFMMDLLKTIQEECPELLEQTWAKWAWSKMPSLNS